MLPETAKPPKGGDAKPVPQLERRRARRSSGSNGYRKERHVSGIINGFSGRWLVAAVPAALLLFCVVGVAQAERVVNAGEPIVLSDDITNRVVVVQSYASNNGHGNNDDGVDSSNPGKGGGGPNGSTDESCPSDGACVDDESGGGGASPSKNK
jgi:hypothetical protein